MFARERCLSVATKTVDGAGPRRTVTDADPGRVFADVRSGIIPITAGNMASSLPNTAVGMESNSGDRRPSWFRAAATRMYTGVKDRAS